MKILGCKFWGEDSALCMLDFKKKKIFALVSDRSSRIKKDNFDIRSTLKEFENLLKDTDVFASPFNTFDGHDTCLENKGTSYFWLEYNKIIRSIIKPKYISDLKKKKSITTKLKLFLYLVFNPLFIYHYFSWKYFYKRYFLYNRLDKNFHYKFCKKTILEIIKPINSKKKLPVFFDHHKYHAASAYYLSNFFKNKEQAFVFTLDQQGDHIHSSLYNFKNYDYKLLSKSTTRVAYLDNRREVISIGQIYTKFTSILGFRPNCDEGKVEALAAYGKPEKEILKSLNKILFLNKDKSYFFDSNPKEYENYMNEMSLKNELDKYGKENFCASVQKWLEEIVVNFLNASLPKSKKINLCLAGGVIANVILNYKIYENCNVDKLFVCPAMGDDGSALGAALLSSIEKKLDLDWLSNYEMPYWGPNFERENVRKLLQKNIDKIRYTDLNSDWPLKAAEKLKKNKIIAVFQNQMEFGPRALGNRSILASATDINMRDKINLNIKRRPLFQPFCPAVLEEDREKIFKNSYHHKFMATAFKMRDDIQKIFPSACHIDGTARPQFVKKKDNEGLYEILKILKKQLGYGVVINTSFNLHGRSMVLKPEHALDDFLDSNLEYLYIEGYEVEKR